MGKRRRKKKILSRHKIALTDLSSIRNKHRRREIYVKWKAIRSEDKGKARRARQSERERLGADAPPIKPRRTIETAYPPIELNNENIPNEEFDEFTSHYDEHAPTKVLITNSLSIKRTTKVSKKFIADLVTLIPNSAYYKRKNYSLEKIQEQAMRKGFTSILVIGEDHKKIHTMYHICLPEGPCAHYRVSNVVCHDDIKRNDKYTTEYPELIAKRFTTKLGKRVVRMLQSIFPSNPNLQSRQTVTFHNQRDYIFFRRHRYEFKSRESVGIREVGPRFTLRLKSLKQGKWDKNNQTYEYKYSKKIDPRRKNHFL